MGKYIKRKTKTATTEVSLMEVPSLGGVLTRAKTLALQKAGSYIQLRSRRLVKPNSVKKQKNVGKLLSGNSSTVNGNVDSVKCMKSEKKDDEEGSFGENCLDIEGKGRTTRETTPCSLIRNPDALKTPGSSTKPMRSTRNRHIVENTSSRHIPSTSEMDEFFSGPEKQQQKLFIEKYNFDPVNDKPLHGRYEWEKLDTTKKS